jgi:hypothetical protein
MKQQTKKTILHETAVTTIAPIYSQVSSDLRNSLLIVSVVANLFILTAWIALQVTTQFDFQISSFLFNR